MSSSDCEIYDWDEVTCTQCESGYFLNDGDCWWCGRGCESCVAFPQTLSPDCTQCGSVFILDSSDGTCSINVMFPISFLLVFALAILISCLNRKGRPLHDWCDRWFTKLCQKCEHYHKIDDTCDNRTDTPILKKCHCMQYCQPAHSYHGTERCREQVLRDTFKTESRTKEVKHQVSLTDSEGYGITYPVTIKEEIPVKVKNGTVLADCECRGSDEPDYRCHCSNKNNRSWIFYMCWILIIVCPPLDLVIYPWYSDRTEYYWIRIFTHVYCGVASFAWFMTVTLITFSTDDFSDS